MKNLEGCLFSFTHAQTPFHALRYSRAHTHLGHTFTNPVAWVTTPPPPDDGTDGFRRPVEQYSSNGQSLDRSSQSFNSLPSSLRFLLFKRNRMSRGDLGWPDLHTLPWPYALNQLTWRLTMPGPGIENGHLVCLKQPIVGAGVNSLAINTRSISLYECGYNREHSMDGSISNTGSLMSTNVQEGDTWDMNIPGKSGHLGLSSCSHSLPEIPPKYPPCVSRVYVGCVCVLFTVCCVCFRNWLWRWS